jgi:hypothetical protein
MSSPTDRQEIDDTVARGISSDQVMNAHHNDSEASSQHHLTRDEIELTTFEANETYRAHLAPADAEPKSVQASEVVERQAGDTDDTSLTLQEPVQTQGDGTNIEPGSESRSEEKDTTPKLWPSSAGKAHAGLPFGWERRRTIGGRLYYLNHKTRITTFKCPPGAVETSDDHTLVKETPLVANAESFTRAQEQYLARLRVTLADLSVSKTAIRSDGDVRCRFISRALPRRQPA